MNKSNAERFEWAIKVANILVICLLPIVGGFAAHTAHSLIDHEKRLVSIEANRFTSQHGQKIQIELSRIWQEIASLPREVPPSWFLDRVDKLEQKLDKVDEKLDTLCRDYNP